jgi:small-conductance mechanosensitive channel
MLGDMPDQFVEMWGQHPWARLGVIAMGALLLALVLHRVAAVLLYRLTRHRPMAANVVDRAEAPMAWLVPLLMLSLALQWTPELPAPGVLDAIDHLLLIGLIASATWLGVRCIGAAQAFAMHEFPLDTADNLQARRVLTQVRVLGRTATVLLILIGAAAMLLTIPGVRQLGTSLLASAGLAGLALGLAAKPVLSNLLAGLQIALTQPIRIDDVVIVQNEWGRIEEITTTYVVVHLWDDRRLIVPLNYFIQNPIQNWTRATSQITGTVYLWLDYRTPLAPLRDELKRLCAAAPEWDQRVCVLQVTDSNEHAMQLRVLASAADSGRSWDLRCRLREGLIAFVQQHHPQSLPRMRAELEDRGQSARAVGRAAMAGGTPANDPPGSRQRSPD